jgi:hypothetical protein
MNNREERVKIMGSENEKREEKRAEERDIVEGSEKG